MVRFHEFSWCHHKLIIEPPKVYMSSWVLRAFDLLKAFFPSFFQPFCPLLLDHQSAGSTNVYHPMVSDPFLCAGSGHGPGRLVALSTSAQVMIRSLPQTQKKTEQSVKQLISEDKTDFHFCFLAFMMIHVDSFWFQDVGSRMSRHHNNLLAL